MRYRIIQEDRVVNLDWATRDDVAKAYVYLNRDACSVNDCMGVDSDSAVFQVVADRRRRETLNVESNAVVWDRCRADGLESVSHGFWIIGTRTEEIQVSRRTKGIRKPM
jgi:hypothetical protein